MRKCSKCGYPTSGGSLTDQCFCEPLVKKFGVESPSRIFYLSDPLANPYVKVKLAQILGAIVPVGRDLLPDKAAYKASDLIYLVSGSLNGWHPVDEASCYSEYRSFFVPVNAVKEGVVAVRDRGETITLV